MKPTTKSKGVKVPVETARMILCIQGLSAEIAARSGVSQSMISKVLRGKKNASPRVRAAISSALNEAATIVRARGALLSLQIQDPGIRDSKFKIQHSTSETKND